MVKETNKGIRDPENSNIKKPLSHTPGLKEPEENEIQSQ